MIIYLDSGESACVIPCVVFCSVTSNLNWDLLNAVLPFCVSHLTVKYISRFQLINSIRHSSHSRKLPWLWTLEQILVHGIYTSISYTPHSKCRQLFLTGSFPCLMVLSFFCLIPVKPNTKALLGMFAVLADCTLPS